jgi:hypothetical protein
VWRVAQQVARGHQRLGGHHGQLFSHGQRGGHGIVGHVPDHAPLLGLGSAGSLSPVMASAMARARPDALRQQPGAPRVRHQADLAEGLDEAGTRRGNGDVTGHGQRGTRAGRHAIDGRDTVGTRSACSRRRVVGLKA